MLRHHHEHDDAHQIEGETSTTGQSAPVTDDAPAGPIRFHEGEGGRRTAPVLDVAAYIRGLRSTLELAYTLGHPAVMNLVFVDSAEPAPQFAFVPMDGLTPQQADALVKQWHLDVCDALGVDHSLRPAEPPTLVLKLFDELADDAEGTRPDGPDDSGGGAA